MKVRELTSLLLGFPKDAEVLLHNDLGLGKIGNVYVITVVERKNSMFKDGKYVDYANIDDDPKSVRDAVLID